MSMPVYNVQAYIERLKAIIAHEFPATTGSEAQISLYANNVQPDANMGLEMFGADEVNSIALTLNAPAVNDQGLVVACSNRIAWQTTGPKDPTTYYGIVVTNTDDSRVIVAQRFDTPQVLGGLYPTVIAGVFRITEPLTSMGWIDVD